MAQIAVINVQPGDLSGVGSYSGTVITNQRGRPFVSAPIAGSYQISSNCFVTFVVPEQIGEAIRGNALTGYVSNGGAFIQLSTVFDEAVQLSGG